MTDYRRPVEVDAVNWCHSPVLYRSQLAAAQHRCDVNGTTELVAHVDSDGNIIEKQVITAARTLPSIARNNWEKTK